MTRRNNHDGAAIDIAAECEHIYATVAAATGRTRAELEAMPAPWIFAAFVAAQRPAIAASQDEREARR